MVIPENVPCSAKATDSMTSVVGYLSKYGFYFMKSMFPKKSFQWHVYSCWSNESHVAHLPFWCGKPHSVWYNPTILCGKKQLNIRCAWLACQWNRRRVTQVTTLHKLFLFWKNPPFNFFHSLLLGVGWIQGFPLSYLYKKKTQAPGKMLK